MGPLSPARPRSHRDLQVQLFEVADRLLEDMAQDLQVDELRGRPRRNLIVQRGRPVFVGRQPVQALADFVRHLQPVQQIVVREQAAVVLRDLQGRAAPVDRRKVPGSD
jgi:hypothetical protein